MSASLAFRSRASELVGLLAAAALVACGPSTKGGGPGGNNPDGRGSGTGTGSDDADANPSSGVDAMPCASMPHKAMAAPLDMYIMLDQSGSMQGTKWTQVTTGLKTFVQQPNLDGFSVGLQYFGVSGAAVSCPATCQQTSDCGTGNLCFQNVCLCFGSIGGDSCTAADYAKPEVEISPLPGAATPLVASINAHSPTTGTPTSAALQGAIDHASSWGAAHPSDVTVVVLATDGDPEECDTDLNNIDAIAAAGLAGNPKILTFVIGVGSSLSNLNGIAAAGGTTQAFIVDTNGNIGQQFLDALNTIRGSVLGCRYTIPLPTSGNPDYAHVTVVYTPSGGGPAQTFSHVTNMGACPASGNAWYYDDNANPSQIILCTAACGVVSADKTGEVDIDTPCDVVVN